MVETILHGHLIISEAVGFLNGGCEMATIHSTLSTTTKKNTCGHRVGPELWLAKNQCTSHWSGSLSPACPKHGSWCHSPAEVPSPLVSADPRPVRARYSQEFLAAPGSQQRPFFPCPTSQAVWGGCWQTLAFCQIPSGWGRGSWQSLGIPGCSSN